MSFDDDEQISSLQMGTAGSENEVTVGNAKVKIINVPDAQPEEGKLKVLVELTGKGKPRGRLGLDLVVVLDVSGNMKRQDRLERVKKATEFVIKKLSSNDRVSVVTFAQVANKLCGLRQVNKDSKREIISLVDSISPADGQNILDGLEMASKVLSGRKFTEDRSVGIIVMSSDEQDGGRGAAEVAVAKVPVYTFGFGTGSKGNLTEPHVLDAIARKSAGGTYSDVGKGDDLSDAFAHCFVRLMTVVVQDMKLIMSPQNMSTVEHVYAGDHEQTVEDNTVSVMLGNLYDKETRKVLVHIRHPVTKVAGLQVLRVAYKYRNEQGDERKSPPVQASKKQIINFTQEEIDDLMDEVIRLEREHKMNEGGTLADINLPIGQDTVTPSSEVATEGDGGNQKQALPTDINLPIGQGNVTPSSDVATEGDGGNPKQALPTGKDIVKAGTITPPFELGSQGDIAKLPLISTPYMETPLEQGETFQKKFMNPLPGNKVNLKKKAIPPSPEVVAYGNMENLPLSSTLFTSQDNLNEETIKPSLEDATKDEENAKRKPSPLSSEVTETCDVENLSKDEDNLREETTTPSSELKDYPLPTNLEDVKRKTTPSTSEVATNDDVEKPPVHFTPFTDEGRKERKQGEPFEKDDKTFKVALGGYMEKLFLLFTKLLMLFKLPSPTHQEGEALEKDRTSSLPEKNLNVENTQSSPNVAASGVADEKQAESPDKNHPNLPIDEESLKNRTSTTRFRVIAKGYMEKLVLLFSELLMFVNQRNPTRQEGDSSEKDHLSSSPRGEKNVRKTNTQPSSKVATSDDARHKQAESSDKNHPKLLPTDESDWKDRTSSTTFQVAVKGYMEKLILLFTKLPMFSNPLNRAHKEEESSENKDKNAQPSSKVATSGDAHQEQAEPSDKNHSKSLPKDEDDLKDRTTSTFSSVSVRGYITKMFSLFIKLLMYFNPHNHTQKDGSITTSSNLAARGYIEKLILLFTPRMNTNQRQSESLQTDDTNSLSPDEHHKKERQEFMSRVIMKIRGSFTGISNSVSTQLTKAWTSIQRLGVASFAYCYSPILLVQDALTSLPSEFMTTIKVAVVSVAAAAVFYMLYVGFSYAKFRVLAYLNILYGFGFYNPFRLLDIAIISVVVLLVVAYQVYYQPLFEFFDKHAARTFPNNNFINKEYNISLPIGSKPFKLNLFRVVWRTTFMIITIVISMLLPFLNDVVVVLGAFGFWPLALNLLAEKYVVHKSIPEGSSRWIYLQIMSVACLIVATTAMAGSFVAVVTDLEVYRPFQSSY